ncbi:MAG: hypothetical protein V7788_00190 [Alphaproteobacteria bacterium]
MLLRTKIFAIAMSLVFLIGAGRGGAESVYLADIDDLPLAPGLVEDLDARVSFDKPAGRIVEAVATGGSSGDEVRTFYEQTLPALGWEARGQTRWERGGETLRIEINQGRAPVVVRFSIAPRDQ